MTLDIKKYFKNLIEKEAKISHFQVKVDAGKTSKMNKDIKDKIEAQYGEGFLLDADYVLFFERDEAWDDDSIKKLFELTNRALGKDANMLSKNDFMEIESSQDSGEDPTGEDADPNVGSDVEVTALFLKITIK